MTTDQTPALATGEVYIDGAYAAAADARVSPFDRGYLFGDGVYEVVPVLDGKLIDFAAHVARLDRSLETLSIPRPLDEAGLLDVMRSLVARNAIVEGTVYLQITRGVAPRSFDWPAAPTPVVFAFTEAAALIDNPLAARGVSVALVEDRRWKRRDVKSVNLLPASWAKAIARSNGADDAWMVEADEDGVARVTEGSSNNAFIIDAERRVVSRPLSNRILHGVTRAAIAALLEETGGSFIERAFTPDEAMTAREAFITSARMMVTPVVRIDDRPIGGGAPGPITQRLRALYIEAARQSAI